MLITELKLWSAIRILNIYSTSFICKTLKSITSGSLNPRTHVGDGVHGAEAGTGADAPTTREGDKAPISASSFPSAFNDNIIYLTYGLH